MVYAADYSIWHQYMGHPSDDILWKLPEIVKGTLKLITISMAKKPCEACVKGKMPSCSFSPSVLQVTKPFQIVQSDLKDMIKRSFNSYYYVLTVLDKFTSQTWSFNLKKQSDTIIHAQQFVPYAKNQHNALIGTVTTFLILNYYYSIFTHHSDSIAFDSTHMTHLLQAQSALLRFTVELSQLILLLDYSSHDYSALPIVTHYI